MIALAASGLTALPASANAAGHPVVAHVSARPAATTVATGSVVAVSGTVKPGVAGVTVEVQRLAGSAWLPIGSAKSAAQGGFTVNVMAPGKAGQWTIRASAGAKVVTGALKLTVTKTAYKITAKLAAKTVSHGTPILVTGTVRPKATGAVQLQFLDGKVWRTIGTAKLAGSAYKIVGKRPNGLSKLRVLKVGSKTVAGGTSSTLKVTVRQQMVPVITTGALPTGVVGRPYSATLTADAGVGPYSWRVTTGAVPGGLVLSPAGTISGVPIGAYTEAFGATATGSDGGEVTKTLSITVAGTTVTGWGSNSFQQLVGSPAASSPVPVAAKGLTKVSSVAAGAYSAYALRADGTVWAWGDNSYGQLGNGGPPSERTNVPVQVTGLIDIVSIASGTQTAYAQRKDGTVFSWGFNVSGELGNGGFTNSNVPVQIKSLTFITKIAAGAWNGYALGTDGTLYGWGFDAHGEVGDGTVHLGGIASPVAITGVSNVAAIGGGGGGGYAVRTDGSVWAWGANSASGLGSGVTGDSSSPVAVPGVTNAVAVAGGATAGYALRGDGTVVSWGGNGSGQLGNNDTANSATVVSVAGLAGVVAIAAGGSSAYAVKSDGTVWAWGGNGSGQLGNNTATDNHVPTQVTGLAGAFAVAAGQSAAYALTSP